MQRKKKIIPTYFPFLHGNSKIVITLHKIKSGFKKRIFMSNGQTEAAG